MSDWGGIYTSFEEGHDGAVCVCLCVIAGDNTFHLSALVGN